MSTLREIRNAARNLILFARVWCDRRARATWLANFKQFDARYYLCRYREVGRSGINALVHYALFGEREGRLIPSAFLAGSENTAFPPVPERDGRKTLLIALPSITFGGAETLFRQIAGWAKQDGWKVVVVTTVDAPELPKNPGHFDGVADHVYELTGLFRTQGRRLEFVRLLAQSLDVLLLGGSEPMYHWLPELKRERPDLRVIDHVFNGVCVHGLNNHCYASCIDATVVQSRRVLGEAEAGAGTLAGVRWLIPLGVEIPEAGVEGDHGEILIGYFGRLSEEKGPDLFVRIAAAIFARDPQVRFVMAGDGPMREEIRKLVQAKGLESVIRMPGHVSPVADLMRQAAFMILPSRIDGTPSAVLEAQALGVPVIAARAGGLPEMIAEGESGFLCPVEDVDAFAAAAAKWIENPELHRRMGANSRRAVIEQRSMEQMKANYLRLLNDPEDPGRCRV